MANKTSFYVSAITSRDETRLRISFWPDDTMHTSLELVPAEALRLAAKITRAVDDLPRVASEADLGLVA